MTYGAPGGGNVVTLSLVQGESANPTATFTEAMAARQIVLGAGPAAHWKVRGHGVEAAHIELYWDGKVLWLRDAGSLSGVYVGVDRADDWQQVFDGAEICFGQAVLRARVVGDAPQPRVATGPINPKAAAFIDAEESTMVFSNDAIASALRGAPGVSPSTPAPAPRATSSLPAAPAPAPRMAPSSPAPAAQRMPDPEPGPGSARSEATVIRQSPYAAMEAAMGNGPSNSFRPLAGMPAAAAPGPAIAAPTYQPPMPAPQMQPQPGYLPPGMPQQPSYPPHGMGAPGMGAPAFGGHAFGPLVGPPSPTAPPAAAPAHGFDDPFGPIDAPPAPPTPGTSGTTPGPGGVPMRTWLLAALTVAVAALGWTFNGPARPGRRSAGPHAVRQIVRTTGAAAPTSNNILHISTGPNQLLGYILQPAITPVPNPGGPPRYPPPNAQDPIKLAADAVAAHRFTEAAALYDQLATQYHDVPLFHHFALVLRARAAQAACTPGAPGCPPAAAH